MKDFLSQDYVYLMMGGVAQRLTSLCMPLILDKDETILTAFHLCSLGDNVQSVQREAADRSDHSFSRQSLTFRIAMLVLE